MLEAKDYYKAGGMLRLMIGSNEARWVKWINEFMARDNALSQIISMIPKDKPKLPA